MIVKGIAFTAYPSSDVAATRRWYEEMLGLRFAGAYVERGSERYNEAHLGNGCFSLMSAEWTSRPPGSAASVYFEVDDLDERFDGPVCRQASFSDPEGNKVTIHESTSEIASGRADAGLRIGSIVWGVRDVPRAIRFWAEALDYRPLRPPTDDWAILVPKSGPGPQLAISLVSSDAQDHRRHHLDLYASDRDAEVVRLTSLGATKPDWLYEADADYVVLADPDGNRFCVIEK